MAEPPRIYMDLCALKRPFDEPREGRVRLEAEAVIALAYLAESGAVRLVSSHVLEAENDRNPDLARRERARETLARMHGEAKVTDAVEQRARELVSLGFGPFDALHVAVAESARVAAVLTVDDGLLKRAGRAALRVRVLNPVVFVEELTHEDR